MSNVGNCGVCFWLVNTVLTFDASISGIIWFIVKLAVGIIMIYAIIRKEYEKK